VISVRSPLALGSASPRRRALLEALGIPLLVAPVDVDERRLGAETPVTYLERVVAAKLDAARADERTRGAAAVLVADTTVLLDGEILGKPSSVDEARSMLARLSGRTHEVRTRFAIAVGARPAAHDTDGAELHAETVITAVEFRRLEADEIDRYAATGEGSDKAGAYAIQGIGSFAVSRIAGSYANVVGLPVCEVIVALRRSGLLGNFP
jgi:septum formation protein